MGHPTKAEALEIQNRRKNAVALRMGGAQWQAIADQLGYNSDDAARIDVKRALEVSRQELREGAEELRALQVQRIERLLMGVWPQAVQGDLKASEAAGRHIDRLSDLLGLKAPIQHEVITVDSITQRLRALSEQLGHPIPERLALPSAGVGGPIALEGPGAGEG